MNDFNERFNIWLIGVPGGEKCVVEKVLKVIMVKKFPNLPRNVNLHVQEVGNHQTNKFKEIHSKAQYNHTSWILETKDKFLKQPDKNDTLPKGDLNDGWIHIRNSGDQKEVAQYFQVWKEKNC